jgi:hypothetical protein
VVHEAQAVPSLAVVLFVVNVTKLPVELQTELPVAQQVPLGSLQAKYYFT